MYILIYINFTSMLSYITHKTLSSATRYSNIERFLHWVTPLVTVFPSSFSLLNLLRTIFLTLYARHVFSDCTTVLIETN